MHGNSKEAPQKSLFKTVSCNKISAHATLRLFIHHSVLTQAWQIETLTSHLCGSSLRFQNLQTPVILHAHHF